MTGTLTYLYAITDAPVCAPGVQVLSVRSLYLVATAVPASEFSEAALQSNFRNLDWLERHARHHEAMIEQLLSQATVVPCRFPTLFYSADAAKTFLMQHYEMFVHLIEKFRGREEWGVKVFSQPETSHQAVAELPELQALDAEIARASAGKAFLLKKQRAQRLEELRYQLQQALLQQLQQSLEQWVVETKLNPILPKEVTGRSDEMILNAAFLIDQDRVKAFLSEVERLHHVLSAKGLSLETSGPWAAYNFCTLPAATQRIAETL